MCTINGAHRPPPPRPVRNAAGNVALCPPYWRIPWAFHPGAELLGYRHRHIGLHETPAECNVQLSILLFIFPAFLPSFFPGWPRPHSSNAPGSHSCQHWTLSSCLIFASLIDLNLIASISVSLRISEVEHLFKCFQTKFHYRIQFKGSFWELKESIYVKYLTQFSVHCKSSTNAKIWKPKYHSLIYLILNYYY